MQAQNAHLVPGAKRRSKSGQVSGLNSLVAYAVYLSPRVGPYNARHQARREAGAQRTLYAVACMPSLAGDGLGRLEHADVLTDTDRALLRNDGFDMVLEPR